MLKYDSNSGSITIEFHLKFSPRSWWGHIKYWWKYLTDSKERYWYKERRKAFRKWSEEVGREANFLALFGMTEEEFKQKYK